MGINVSNILIAALLFSGLQAADDVAEQLMVCAAIKESESRLACFDAIARTSVADQTEANVVTKPRVEPASVSVPETEPTKSSMPTAAGSLDPAEVSEVAEPVEAVGSADSAEMGAETMAREEKQKAKNNEKKKKKEKAPRELVTATISRVTPQLDGRWSVTLDNGQVWRESQGSKVGLPSEGAAVTLSKGRFGGYRMEIDGLYRTAWVKRTK
ncbi:MAG: hypothetical protein AAGA33_02880 [Pseudomonadota bacterium]